MFTTTKQTKYPLRLIQHKELFEVRMFFFCFFFFGQQDFAHCQCALTMTPRMFRGAVSTPQVVKARAKKCLTARVFSFLTVQSDMWQRIRRRNLSWMFVDSWSYMSLQAVITMIWMTSRRPAGILMQHLRFLYCCLATIIIIKSTTLLFLCPPKPRIKLVWGASRFASCKVLSVWLASWKATTDLSQSCWEIEKYVLAV